MPLIAADAMKEEVTHQHHRKERGHPGNVVQVIILVTAECDLVPIIILRRLCAILILDEMVRATILIRQRLPFGASCPQPASMSGALTAVKAARIAAVFELIWIMMDPPSLGTIIYLYYSIKIARLSQLRRSAKRCRRPFDPTQKEP